MYGRYTTLLDFFHRLFGPKGSRRLNKARQCFVESMAAYSIVCYLLQVRQYIHMSIKASEAGQDCVHLGCTIRPHMKAHMYTDPPRL